MAESNVSKRVVMNKLIKANEKISELILLKEKELCPNCSLFSRDEKNILISLYSCKCFDEGKIFAESGLNRDIFEKIISKLEDYNLIVRVFSKKEKKSFLSLTYDGRCAARVFSNKVRISPSKFLRNIDDDQLSVFNEILDEILK